MIKCNKIKKKKQFYKTNMTIFSKQTINSLLTNFLKTLSTIYILT